MTPFLVRSDLRLYRSGFQADGHTEVGHTMLHEIPHFRATAAQLEFAHDQ